MREYDSAHAPRVSIRDNERPFAMFDLNEWALSPAARAWTYSLAIGAGGAIVTLAYAYNVPLAYIPGTALVTGGFGGFAMLAVRLASYDVVISRERHEERYEPEPEPATAARLIFDLGNGMETPRLWEPRPGAFREWLRDVVRDNDRRVHFSQNQARDRGWTDDRYRLLVTQLRDAGLIANELRNGTVVCTQHGLTLAREWLRQNGGE